MKVARKVITVRDRVMMSKVMITIVMRRVKPSRIMIQMHCIEAAYENLYQNI